MKPEWLCNCISFEDGKFMEPMLDICVHMMRCLLLAICELIASGSDGKEKRLISIALSLCESVF